MLTRGGTTSEGYYHEVLAGKDGGKPQFGEVPVIIDAKLYRSDDSVEPITFDERFVPRYAVGVGSVALAAAETTEAFRIADLEAEQQWREIVEGIGPDDFSAPGEPADHHYGSYHEPVPL